MAPHKLQWTPLVFSLALALIHSVTTLALAVTALVLRTVSDNAWWLTLVSMDTLGLSLALTIALLVTLASTDNIGLSLALVLRIGIGSVSYG